MTRQTVPSRVRFEVLRRDGFRCRYCGTPAPETGAGLTVDHVIPVALGGTNDPQNLVAACVKCNAGKASSSPDEATVAQVSDDVVRWKAAIQQAAAEMAGQREHIAGIVEMVDDEWTRWSIGDKEVPRPDDWAQSIASFATAGLWPDDLCELLDVTMRSKASPTNKWRYFCGCCWKRIEDTQRRAAEILQEAPCPG